MVEVREETDVELFDLVAIECGIESTAAVLRFVRGAVAFTCCLFPFPFEGLFFCFIHSFGGAVDGSGFSHVGVSGSGRSLLLSSICCCSQWRQVVEFSCIGVQEVK